MAGGQRGKWKERGKNKGKPGTTPQRQRNLLQGDIEQRSRAALPQLSLVDIARNTERHGDPGRRRQQSTGLQFVHGGLLESTIEPPGTPIGPKPEAAGEGVGDEDESMCVATETSFSPDDTRRNSHGLPDRSADPPESSIAKPTEGAGEGPSDSEEDVVIFRGRLAPGHQRPDLQHDEKHHPATEGHSMPSNSKTQPGSAKTSTWKTKKQSLGTRKIRRGRGGRSAKSNAPGRRELEIDSSEDEEALEDYIANILSQDSSDESDHQQADKSTEVDNRPLSHRPKLPPASSLSLPLRASPSPESECD